MYWHFRDLYGSDDRRSLRIMGLIASRLNDVKRHDEAIATFEAMIEICRAADTPDEEYIARIDSADELVKRAALADN